MPFQASACGRNEIHFYFSLLVFATASGQVELSDLSRESKDQAGERYKRD